MLKLQQKARFYFYSEKEKGNSLLEKLGISNRIYLRKA